MESQLKNLESYLLQCWSIKTSSKWTPENPYKGQCGVTALVVNDLFGGDILKTKVENQWHYYNFILGHRYDFTAKQFVSIPDYQDILSNREEAYSDTNEYQYGQLKDSMGKELLGITDISRAEHYTWGSACDGWHLLKSDSLSIIQERMPRSASEKLHYHERSRQFFYILSGEATFEIDGLTCRIASGKGVLIKPGARHRILNESDSDLEFIVISEPKSHGDRIDMG